jgi:hypothetical protein
VFITPGFNPQHQIMKMINDKKLYISTDIDLFKKQTSVENYIGNWYKLERQQ